MTETFTCASCGGTFDKGWSDEEAAAEAEELFPGINVSDPAEAGVVCDGCYRHIMSRARAEAPELIGEGWRGQAPEPIPDFPGFIASLTAGGYTPNPCSGPAARTKALSTSTCAARPATTGSSGQTEESPSTT